MAERIQEVKKVQTGGVTTETVQTVEERPAAPVARAEVATTSAAERLVWYVAGVLLVLLAFRFVFILLGANTNNAFANFIYTTSRPFAAPFFGLFGYTLQYGVSRVEISTIVAMAVYALVAYGIAKLINISTTRA